MARPVILGINDTPPEDFPNFFFDSNIWIAILNQMAGRSSEVAYQPYLDFWDALVHIHTRKGNTMLEKRTKYFPKVMLPAVTLSETINAQIRISFSVYQKSNPGSIPRGEKPDFKKHYRPTQDYQKQLTRILADFQAIEDYVELIDDKFSGSNIFNEFFQFNPDFDFNDYFYARLFKGTGIPIMTHDLDFASFEDITILTSNSKLLKI
ncbi:MAG: hypothetical protein ACKV1O_26545 [Saprospiraceae bacterium]